MPDHLNLCARTFLLSPREISRQEDMVLNVSKMFNRFVSTRHPTTPESQARCELQPCLPRMHLVHRFMPSCILHNGESEREGYTQNLKDTLRTARP